MARILRVDRSGIMQGNRTQPVKTGGPLAARHLLHVAVVAGTGETLGFAGNQAARKPFPRPLL